MTTKVCSKCGEEKDIDEFNKRGNVCKNCIKIRDKIYYELNRDKILEQKREYSILNREHKAEYDKKYRVENHEKILENRKQYCINNKTSVNESNKKYREENKDKKSEYDKNYRKSPSGKTVDIRHRHRRRARSKESPCTLTLQQWEKILKSQGNKCAICGKRFCKSRPPTKDHIIPLSKGGGLTFENVQALCKSCNSSKNASLDHTKIVTWCAA
jgi:5-methylcytosine-specific restriction endonuclease McrA